jgi:hypothetical protein
MDSDGPSPRTPRITRREALRRSAAVTGAAWTAPVLMSLRTPAYAQYPPGPGCEEGCAYVAHFDLPSVACSQCQTVCFDDCARFYQPRCVAPGCARITSVTCLEDDPTTGANTLRVCTDCQLINAAPLDLSACISVEEDCTCVGGTVDPSDPRCARYDLIFEDACQRARVNVSFKCDC